VSGVPHELPAGWQNTTLREIAEIVGGVTKDAKKSSAPGFREVPYLRVANVQRGRLDLADVKLISASEADIQKLKLLPGDILLNEGGDRDKLGRGWIWRGQLPVCIHQNHVFRARLLSHDIDPVYVAHFTNSMAQAYFVQHGSQTTNLASISLTKLGSLPVQLPPAREQTRIVEKLEELLSDLDAGVAELKAAQKKLQQYRQSLLKAAVEGSLTAAWREANPAPEETGADLLARILRERRARWEAQQLARFEAQGKAPPKGWQDKYVEPVAPDAALLPHLPRGWTWCSVDQLAHVGTGVTPLRSKSAYFDGGSVPWVTSGALNEEVVSKATEMVTELALQECRLEMYPPGSLLVAMYGEGKTRGKCAELGLHATINQAIAAIVLLPGAQACKEFVKTFLLDSYEAMRAQASGGVQPNLNLQIVKALALPLPPLVEQAEIVTALAGQLDGLNELSKAVGTLQRHSTAQRQNLLRAAFAGQLVPQDPADEPAAELLARIRAERAKAPGKARKTRGAPQQEAV
jgi:type I restriction enzyme, S subunit